MKTITLRNLSPELVRRLQDQAADRGTSITKTVIRLLEHHLGVRGASGERQPHDDLDHLIGAWSPEENADFKRALSQQRAIDPGLWE
jgi:hypothetical protein